MLETRWEQIEVLPDPPAVLVPEDSTEGGEQIVELEGVTTALFLEKVQAHAADEPLQLRVIVRDAGEDSLALRAALRCLAMERPRWTCSWWQLPPLVERQPDEAERARL